MIKKNTVYRVLFIMIIIGICILKNNIVFAACDECSQGAHSQCSVGYTWESISASQHEKMCRCDGHPMYIRGNHSWEWSSSSHKKTCSVCDKSISHDADFKYYSSSKEICDEGGCLVKRNHSLSDWKSDDSDHWKECSRPGCSGYKFDKAGHTWRWSSTSHKKECSVCGYSITHAQSFQYYNDSQEICSYGDCTVTRGHTLSSWKKNSSTHWKTCSNCTGYSFNEAGHTWNVESATCTLSKKCSVCDYVLQSALGHTGGSATCKDLAVCENCHKGYGSYANHSYTKPCTVVHCDGFVCKWCGLHQGGCGGGPHEGGSATCLKLAVCDICGEEYGSYANHSYTKTSCGLPHCVSQICQWCGTHKTQCGGDHDFETCSHCKYSYCCTKGGCEYSNHTCSCNRNGRCTTDPHCKDERWCTYCGTHTHVPCNTNATCPEPHCNQKVCSVCGKNHQGTCGGGHVYEWVTNEKFREAQTHTYKCKVTSTCTATNGTHSASWSQANTSHISTCTKGCGFTYDHSKDPNIPNIPWSKSQRNATEAHPCIWHGGCSATHQPSWGAYYKVNGGKDGDTDGGPHTRECSICNITQIYHNYTDEAWFWENTSVHMKTCKTCGLRQSQAHNFTEYEEKTENFETHSELYKHWKLCTVCDSTRKEVDGLHTDDGSGVCSLCGQILWKVITADNEDITDSILDEETASVAFREAKREEKIKIVEVVDNNGSPKTQYIQTIVLNGSEQLTAVNNVITITKNGEYTFRTGRGGYASFIIDNISREILIDKIVSPITSTTGEVTITLRTNKAEKRFNKDIYIKEGTSAVTDSELSNGNNPYTYIKDRIDKNGTYYFTARDTAGNTKQIEILIDNIINGQATVAISNDVFINGYIFTEVLINPDEDWEIDKDNIYNVIKANVHKAESSGSGSSLGNNNIKLIKIMDMQRKEVNSSTYLPGSYYIQLAIGGNVFNTAGTYIVDLDKVVLETDSNIPLPGRNRVIVEVQDLKDLT